MNKKVLQHPSYYAHRFVPAAQDNYTLGREGLKPSLIVVHIMQGSYEGSISWSQNPSSDVSWHYACSEDGHTTQQVSELNTCWTNSSWWHNLRGVNIEHEGFHPRAASEVPEAQLHASAKLAAGACLRWGIPVDRDRIIGHTEVPNVPKPCPSGWPWDRYLKLIRAYMRANAGAKPGAIPGSKPAAPSSANDHLFDTDYGVTAEKALGYVLSKGAHPARAAQAIRAIFAVERPETAWRPAVRAAQSYWETAGWNYGHDSRWANFAGIKKGGIVGDEPRDFEIPRTAEAGAHMQANHGRAYSLREAVAPVHDRYSDALAAQQSRGGPITRVSQLGGGIWATDPAYADRLLGVIAGMRRAAPRVPDELGREGG